MYAGRSDWCALRNIRLTIGFHDNGGIAHHHGARRHVPNDKCAAGDPRSTADANASHDYAMRAKPHVILDNGKLRLASPSSSDPFALSNGDTMKSRDVAANARSRRNHEAPSVNDAEARTDLCLPRKIHPALPRREPMQKLAEWKTNPHQPVAASHILAQPQCHDWTEATVGSECPHYQGDGRVAVVAIYIRAQAPQRRRMALLIATCRHLAHLALSPPSHHSVPC